MEVTKFVLDGRDKAKLFGDAASYRSQLSNRIHNLRKKLGIATKPRAKYSSKASITARDIGSNHEFAHLLLLTAERAWANAMSMRETHASEKKGVTGSTRSHIISRLHKATIYAKNLCGLLNDQASSGATLNDILEARAYAASLTGSMAFEKQSWDACVRSYSEARIIYCVLAVSIKSDIFKGLLEDPIDQSIRYGAYQLSIPRTVAVPSIAKKFFPRSESDLVSWVERLDPDALSEQPTRAQTTTTGSGAIPKSINWRSRTVELEDATIATALASVNSATSKLSDALASVTTTWPKEQATAYDDILIASQDAVDATKHAIDELVAEGVGQGDKRIQSLQITRTAASYEMVSWRIGRNRVLVGEHDGAMAEISVLDPSRNKGASLVKQEGIGRKLTLLREKSVLYDSILQSLDSIMELPGVAADSKFVEELDAKYAYFSALKCLTTARSHALLSNLKNTLSLLARASEKCQSALFNLSSPMDTSDSSPPNISVFPYEIQFLSDLLAGEVQRYRALVELSNISQATQIGEKVADQEILVNQLGAFRLKGYQDVVSFPPKLEPVPVKPLFFDAAWNYIDYPGRDGQNKVPVTSLEKPLISRDEISQQKKGWFGFGR